MIKRSVKEGSQQLVCVIATPCPSLYQPAQLHTSSGFNSVTSSMGTPCLALVPLAFFGEAHEHGLGNIVASKLDIMQNQFEVANSIMVSNQGAEPVAAVASIANCSAFSSP
ncbi:hypothetical protein SLE2022_051260 [Rubroshorea leprosula]